MGLTIYLAATAGELSTCSYPTFPIAWMACHFSPCNAGLSNLPETLPQRSLIMINDSAPIGQHDPQTVAQQLHTLLQTLNPLGFVLDFQRRDSPENKAMAEFLVQVLPCPVAVSDLYAESLSCPVFLSAPPLSIPLETYVEPWKNREIWLEAVLTQETLTLTRSGCAREETFLTKGSFPFFNEQLHCHYDFSLREDQAIFTLRRTRSDLDELLSSGKKLGITTAIGLYQQTKNSSTI